MNKANHLGVPKTKKSKILQLAFFWNTTHNTLPPPSSPVLLLKLVLKVYPQKRLPSCTILQCTKNEPLIGTYHSIMTPKWVAFNVHLIWGSHASNELWAKGTPFLWTTSKFKAILRTYHLLFFQIRIFRQIWGANQVFDDRMYISTLHASCTIFQMW